MRPPKRGQSGSRRDFSRCVCHQSKHPRGGGFTNLHKHATDQTKAGSPNRPRIFTAVGRLDMVSGKGIMALFLPRRHERSRLGKYRVVNDDFGLRVRVHEITNFENTRAKTISAACLIYQYKGAQSCLRQLFLGQHGNASWNSPAKDFDFCGADGWFLDLRDRSAKRTYYDPKPGSTTPSATIFKRLLREITGSGWNKIKMWSAHFSAVGTLLGDIVRGAFRVLDQHQRKLWFQRGHPARYQIR